MKGKILDFLVLIIVVEHVWLMGMEMFRWTRGFAAEIAGYDQERAELTAPLAANIGLYNGFIATGLLLSYTLSMDTPFSKEGTMHLYAGALMRNFFLYCVLLAGIYGGVKVKRSILAIQAAPAFVALLLIWTSR